MPKGNIWHDLAQLCHRDEIQRRSSFCVFRIQLSLLNIWRKSRIKTGALCCRNRPHNRSAYCRGLVSSVDTWPPGISTSSMHKIQCECTECHWKMLQACVLCVNSVTELVRTISLSWDHRSIPISNTHSDSTFWIRVPLVREHVLRFCNSQHPIIPALMSKNLILSVIRVHWAKTRWAPRTAYWNSFVSCQSCRHPKRLECRVRAGICQNCLDIARFLVERSGVGRNSCQLVNICWRLRDTALFRNVGNYSDGTM
jgi:hypothetical protein